jgi:hypothetical protein
MPNIDLTVQELHILQQIIDRQSFFGKDVELITALKRKLIPNTEVR